MKKNIATYIILFYLAVNGAGAQGVMLLRGPYLQVPTSNSIIIRWRTNIPTQSMVTYGTSMDKSLQKRDSSNVTDHELKITGLSPYNKYYYSIGDLAAVLQGDADNYFYTLPAPGAENLYRIGVLGDCGNNSVNQVNVKKSLLNYIGSNYLNAWILLGDNAYTGGTEVEYQSNFFNIYKDDLLKKSPLWVSPGNHDYANAFDKQQSHDIPYYSIFSFPQKGEAGGVASATKSYYSFDIGNIHFLSLDSYGLEDSLYRLSDTLSPQVTWVKKDLELNKNKGWIIVFFHHPPYTMGSHNSDVETELVKLRENFIPILERYQVDLVMNGHSHVYERSALMKGYYGNNASFSASQFDISSSSGAYDGSVNSAPYIKGSDNNGTVYVVTGSAGQLGGKQPDWPMKAMQYADVENGGAVILEVQGNRLDEKWVCADGQVRDHFTMMKEVNKNSTITINEGDTAVLTASYTGNYNWSGSDKKDRTLKLSPEDGTYMITVNDDGNFIKDTFNLIVLPVSDSQIVNLSVNILKSPHTQSVYWETSKEKNTNYFEVQHSTDKLTFTALTKVASLGNSNIGKSYTYSDTAVDPLIKNHYYRIKTMFASGKVAYSKVVKVNMDSIVISEKDISLAPNPSRYNEMRIKLLKDMVVVADVWVYDLSGRTVLHKTMSLSANAQGFLPVLGAGQYIVSINIQGSIYVKKIILN
jgi:3',5'-cyclic AMP phosphodiesterase CpdA